MPARNLVALVTSLFIAVLVACGGSDDGTGGDLPPRCGDGVTAGAEACDDGNATTETSCAYGTAACTACDSACSAVLSLTGAFCGDGQLDYDVEACDDGNDVSELECPYGTATCTACDATCSTQLALTGGVCGDGIVQPPEPCDDANMTSGGCSSMCELEGG